MIDKDIDRLNEDDVRDTVRAGCFVGFESASHLFDSLPREELDAR